MTSIRPCPCCGSRHMVEVHEKRVHQYGELMYHVRCKHCGIQTQPVLDRGRCIGVWNTRPDDSPMEALEDLIDRLSLKVGALELRHDGHERRLTELRDRTTRLSELVGEYGSDIRLLRRDLDTMGMDGTEVVE